ncbi:MAG: YkgJ family cysteine cluster protein [Planctomycetota bacterium]
MNAREVPPDPGLRGVKPFRFECHRCGNCCTHGDGHVWLAPGEDARLAAVLGLELDAFRRRHVRTVVDPRSGELREALREEPEGSGRCALLEGANQCTAYTARPEHCRTFPYWPSVLDDADGFERAREVCPGIRPEVDDAARERAFARLAELHRRVENAVANSRAVCLARGVCCRFEEAGHRLYATGLEADYAAHLAPDAPPPEAEGRCPYHVAGRCTAREGRPLGCRTYFCDAGPGEALEALHETFLAEVRKIERDCGIEPTYAPFPDLLRVRGVGRSESS